MGEKDEGRVTDSSYPIYPIAGTQGEARPCSDQDGSGSIEQQQQQQQQHGLATPSDDAEEEGSLGWGSERPHGSMGKESDRVARLDDLTGEQLEAQLETERAIYEGAINLLQLFEEQRKERGERPQAADAQENVELKQEVENELQRAQQRIELLQGTINQRIEHGGNQLGSSGLKTAPSPSSTKDPEPKTDSTLVHESTTETETAAPPLPKDRFLPTFEMVVDLLQRLDAMDAAAEKLRAMDQIVQAILSEPRVKFEIRLEDHLMSIMDGLGEDAGKEVRAGSYRLLRHLIVDQHDVYQLHACYLDIFLVKSLARDSKAELEKEQALRLIRLLLSLPDTERPIQPAVVRAIVAIAENQEEKLRLACLETLGELLIRDISLLVAAEGMRVVLQALTDGPHDLSIFLSMGLLWALDKPDSRQYLRPGVDLEIVLAGFTDSNVKGALLEERVRASSKMIATALKSWSGIMYLNLNGKRALVSLVESLTNPSPIIRDALLDMLFNVFHIEMPPWYTSAAGSRLSGTKRKSVVIDVDSSNKHAPPRQQANLIDHYLSALLLVFIDAGLIEALVNVASGTKDAATDRKISLLISEILMLSNRVLPLSYATRVQSLPRLFSLASSFDTSDARLAAGSTLLAVDQFNRDRARSRAMGTTTGGGGLSESNRLGSDSVEDPLKRGQRQVESTKVKMGMSIEDAAFRNMLLKSRVLETKDDTKWDFETLVELVEGPLLNPRRLDEAMRASKFMRRLLGFYHPFALRYSDLRNDASSKRWTKLGCTLLETLIANPDGVKYMTEDRLLRGIGEALVQLDPIGGDAAVDTLFSKHRCESTLSAGYFEMLGTLTRSIEGTKLLDQMRIFTSFYRISELRNRDDLVEMILETVDYSRDGHPRVFLSKALTSTHRTVRVFATKYLSRLALQARPVPHEWQLRLLLTQLYDPAPEVCELAVQIIEVLCHSAQTLEIVVQMRPCLDHLGAIGTGLLTRFLSTSIGVGYLHEIEFIDQELEDWYTQRNLSYVIELELLLAQGLRIDQLPNLSSSTPFDGTPPRHFYGELVKTEEGCSILEDSDHFLSFVDYIREHAKEDQDPEILLNLKAVLWAVGHIGSTTGGLEFLDDELILPTIVEIAEDSSVYSMRGTAYFVLGLIASTLEGVEMLEEIGWEGVMTPLGGATGLCVPMDLTNFVHTPMWTPPAASPPESLLLQRPTSSHEIELLTALSNLSNHILATKASKTLARLKLKHRALFQDVGVFYRALEMLANRSYRLAVRRYILDLFDLVPIDSKSVFAIMQAGEELLIDQQNQDDDDDDDDGYDVKGSRSVSSLGGKNQNNHNHNDNFSKSPARSQEKGVGNILGLEPRGRIATTPGSSDSSDDDEDDEGTLLSSDEEGDVTGANGGGEDKTMIPLQVCQPLLTIKGFLLS